MSPPPKEVPEYRKDATPHEGHGAEADKQLSRHVFRLTAQGDGREGPEKDSEKKKGTYQDESTTWYRQPRRDVLALNGWLLSWRASRRCGLAGMHPMLQEYGQQDGGGD